MSLSVIEVYVKLVTEHKIKVEEIPNQYKEQVLEALKE